MKKLLKNNIIERAYKTFLQGFLASLIMSLNNVTRVDETLLKSALLGAIASGLSCVMNMIIELLDNKKDDKIN